jgi:hypothetical protein
MQNDPIIAAFGITPSLLSRATAPSLLLAFAHIHGEAGTPSLRIRSAVVGPNGPVLCVEGVHFHIYLCKTTPFSLHSASPRLCTVEPQHLVCFWPSPTSMTIGNTIFAHPECGGGSERSGSVCISMQNTPIIVAFGITPSLHSRTTASSLLF